MFLETGRPPIRNEAATALFWWRWMAWTAPGKTTFAAALASALRVLVDFAIPFLRDYLD